MNSDGSRGEGPGPPLFKDQTEAKRAEKSFWETAPPPPLFSGAGWPAPPLHPLSKGSTTDAYKDIMNIERCKLNLPVKGVWACQVCVFSEL